MKLNIKKKNSPSKLQVKVKGSSKSSSSLGVPDWLTTDPAKQREAASRAKSQQGGKFIPEFWLRDGEEKKVRFRDAGAIGQIWAYSLKLRNGRFLRVTAPSTKQVDLFRDELGMKPSFKAIYEVIDIEGYKDKKTGKRKRNQPRFFVASHKIYEMLEKLREKKHGLDRMDIEVARVGQGNQTTYTFIPEERSPMSLEMKKAERLKPKMWKMFAPPNEAEQRALLNQVATRQDDED